MTEPTGWEAEERPWERPGVSPRDAEPHRGLLLVRLSWATRVLTPLTCCLPFIAFILSLVILLMAQRDLSLMAAGRMDRDGRLMTLTARTDAIFCLVCSGSILLVLLSAPLWFWLGLPRF